MKFLCAAVAGILVCLPPAAPGRAAVLEWTGTLGFELGFAPPVNLTGSGVATVNASGGGIHLTSLRLDGGIQGHATLPLTDPDAATLLSIRIDATLGTGSLRPFAPPAPASQPQLTQRTLPVAGAAHFCLLFPGCIAGLAIPLTASGSVGVGIGSSVAVTGLSLQGAPWTIRSTTVPVATSGGASVALFASGWLHGPFSLTSSTLLPGGSVSLVTPVRITSDAGPPTALFARLTLRFLPEPGRLLLLGSGLSALLLLGRGRLRR